MAEPKEADGSDLKTAAFTVRIQPELADRLTIAGRQLGMERSSLLRLLIIEHLPEYEEKARRARQAGRTGL